MLCRVVERSQLKCFIPALGETLVPGAHLSRFPHRNNINKSLPFGCLLYALPLDPLTAKTLIFMQPLALPANVHKRIIKQKHFPIIVITINLAYRTMYSAWDSGCALFAHFWRPANSTHIFKAMRRDAMINCSHTLPFQPFNGDAGNKLSGNKRSRKMQSPDDQSGLIWENDTSDSARQIFFNYFAFLIWGKVSTKRAKERIDRTMIIKN